MLRTSILEGLEAKKTATYMDTPGMASKTFLGSLCPNVFMMVANVQHKRMWIDMCNSFTGPHRRGGACVDLSRAGPASLTFRSIECILFWSKVLSGNKDTVGDFIVVLVLYF